MERLTRRTLLFAGAATFLTFVGASCLPPPPWRLHRRHERREERSERHEKHERHERRERRERRERHEH